MNLSKKVPVISGTALILSGLVFASASFLSGCSGEKKEKSEVSLPEEAPLSADGSFMSRKHGAEANEAGLKPEVLYKIDIEMQRYVDTGKVAGAVVLINNKGRRGYFEAFGMQDIENAKPMKRDTIFRLMSMTKPLIVIAALTLFDEGKFKLDDPIFKYCPEWENPQVLENGILVPAKFPITPRMLMCHSSGLYYGNLENGVRAAALAFQAAHSRDKNLKEFSESVAKEPLKFQPGTEYIYGLGIDVLGRYLEAVTGKPLDEVLKEKLLIPLKMTDTDFWVPPEKSGRLCKIYRQSYSGILEEGDDILKLTERPSLLLGGHGMCSTMADYEKFCRMIINRGELNGVRILKTKTADIIFKNQLKVPGQKFGLGGAVDGEGSYFWGGADGTQFWIESKNKVFAIFMSQTQIESSPVYPALKALVDEAVEK